MSTGRALVVVAFATLTVVSCGKAEVSADNAFANAATRRAWCMTFNNFVLDHIDVSPEAVNKEAIDRIMSRMLKLANDDRVGKLCEALGMGCYDAANNILKFSKNDEDAYVTRAVALVEDPRTRALVSELSASYQLFVFVAAAGSRGSAELLPRVRQAVVPAKEVSSKIKVEAERIAILAAESSHDVSVFFGRAKAAAVEDGRSHLAKKLGQETSTFVLNMAAGTTPAGIFFDEAHQAVAAAVALAPKTSMEQSKLAGTVLKSIYAPKQFRARVESALGCAEVGGASTKSGWEPSVCALLAGNSLLEPVEFLERLSAALDHPLLASVAEAAKLSKGYLAVMAAESRRPLGPFLDDVRKGMADEQCKKLSEENYTRLGQSAVTLAFANADE